MELKQGSAPDYSLVMQLERLTLCVPQVQSGDNEKLVMQAIGVNCALNKAVVKLENQYLSNVN